MEKAKISQSYFDKNRLVALVVSMSDNNIKRRKLNMTLIKPVEPREWATFLNAFTGRNRGRRARFEIFGPKGSFKEEEREGIFEGISIDGATIKVKRNYTSGRIERSMTDDVTNIRGVAVQYDTDNSEDMLQFTDEKNAMTVLHFASRVDGDS